MITAFQPNAFQNDAFQVGTPVVNPKALTLPPGGGYRRLTRSELALNLKLRMEELEAQAAAVIAKAKEIQPPEGSPLDDSLIDLAAAHLEIEAPDIRVEELTVAQVRAFRDLAIDADDEEMLLLLS